MSQKLIFNRGIRLSHMVDVYVKWNSMCRCKFCKSHVVRIYFMQVFGSGRQQLPVVRRTHKDYDRPGSNESYMRMDMRWNAWMPEINVMYPQSLSGQPRKVRHWASSMEIFQQACKFNDCNSTKPSEDLPYFDNAKGSIYRLMCNLLACVPPTKMSWWMTFVF